MGTETPNQLVARLRIKYSKELEALESRELPEVNLAVDNLEKVLGILDLKGIETSIENIEGTLKGIKRQYLLKEFNKELKLFLVNGDKKR